MDLNRGYLNYVEDNECSLCMRHCGIRQNESAEKCGPMIRGVYLLHFVIKSKGSFYVNKKEYRLGQGDVFVIYPEDMVTYQADEDDPWLFCWMEFGGENAEFLYKRIGIERDVPIVHLNNNVFEIGVTNCLDYIEANENNLSQLRLTGFAYEVLSAFEKKEVSRKIKNEELYINKAVQYIEHNIHKGIYVSDVVGYVGLEHSYFYRIFKKKFGVSPEKYLRIQRIEKAKKYISAGIAYKDIPNLIGINDIFFFYKTFKSITGMTPSEYKNSIEL